MASVVNFAAKLLIVELRNAGQKPVKCQPSLVKGGLEPVTAAVKPGICQRELVTGGP